MSRNKKGQVLRDLSMVELAKKKYITIFVILSKSLLDQLLGGGGGHIDTHRHMNTQTQILTCRPKQPRGQVSVLGIYLQTE